MQVLHTPFESARMLMSCPSAPANQRKSVKIVGYSIVYWAGEYTTLFGCSLGSLQLAAYHLAGVPWNVMALFSPYCHVVLKRGTTDALVIQLVGNELPAPRKCCCVPLHRL